MAYGDQYTAATNAAFVHRVEMAFVRHAVWVLGNAGSSDGARTLAKGILHDPAAQAAIMVKGVASEPALGAKITADATGATVTDAEIESAVQSVYPSYVR